MDIDNSYKESSLNLHPSQDLMNQAYKVKIDKSPTKTIPARTRTVGLFRQKRKNFPSFIIPKLCEKFPDFAAKYFEIRQ